MCLKKLLTSKEEGKLVTLASQSHRDERVEERVDNRPLSQAMPDGGRGLHLMNGSELYIKVVCTRNVRIREQ